MPAELHIKRYSDPAFDPVSVEDVRSDHRRLNKIGVHAITKPQWKKLYVGQVGFLLDRITELEQDLRLARFQREKAVLNLQRFGDPHE